MSGIWDDPPRAVLSDDERAALLPHVTDDAKEDEIDAFVRVWRRREIIRDVTIAVCGFLAGVAATVLAAACWLLF